jgi:transposase
MNRSRSNGKESHRRERRQFSPEFKQEAVRLMDERRSAGVQLSQIARDLDLRPEQLRQWGQQLRDRNGGVLLSGAVEPPEQELRRLRREIAVLRQEREFAKKVAVYFAKESR